MKRATLVAFIIFVWAVASLSYAAETKPLTNQDVVSLVRAGLPESVVLEKIKASKTAFDTSAEALVALKSAGISDGIIRLMVNPQLAISEIQAKPVMTPFGTASDKPFPCQAAQGGTPPWLTGSSPAMWYSTPGADQKSEIQYERGTTERVGFAGFGATLLILRPMRTSLRLPSDAEFYSCMNPTDAPLVRFSLDDEENRRDTSVGRGGPWSQEFSISQDDLVPYAFEKTPEGYFKIKPSKSLSSGEYGFVPQGSMGYFATGERVYTFGVD